MKNYNYVVIRSQFGHEIMAINFANALGFKVIIIPNKENADEYYTEAAKIYENMKFFSNDLLIVPFEQRATYEKEAWDIIGDLKAGKLDDELWLAFAASTLQPHTFPVNLPVYKGLKDKNNVLVVPQKLISDNECGVTASQQSLNPSVFNFLKGSEYNLVLGQHFHKVNDLETVKKLAEEFSMYVPGMSENEEVFGIRGVHHEKYWDMYRQLNKVVGIAGTHTWYMLAMFPSTPHIILYNRDGVEHWGKIAEAYQRLGYPVYAIGFDDTTDKVLLSKKIQSIFETL